MSWARQQTGLAIHTCGLTPLSQWPALYTQPFLALISVPRTAPEYLPNERRREHPPRARLMLARRRDVDSLQEGPEEAVALVELSVAVLTHKLRQSWVLVDDHPQQALEVAGEDTLPWRPRRRSV